MFGCTSKYCPSRFLENSIPMLESSDVEVLPTQSSVGKKPIGTAALVGIVFFAICGSPIGTEIIVTASGPCLGLISVVLIAPLVLLMPMGALITELSVAYPHNGGVAIWCAEALGPTWGFLAGFLTWISDVVDCAIYPTLALSTITQFTGQIKAPFVVYVLKATLAIIMSLPSFFGAGAIGKYVRFLAISVMVPFLIFTLLCLARGNQWGVFTETRPSNMTSTNSVQNILPLEDQIDWAGLSNSLFWNYNGIVSVSLIAGEVAEPQRTYPRAISIAFIIIILTYGLSLFGACVLNAPPWTEWKAGSISEIAAAAGGHLMSALTIGASWFSYMGLYIVSLFCDSFMMCGMSTRGLAPSYLASRSERNGSPQSAILSSLAVTLILVCLEFDDMIQTSNALSSIVQLITIVSFLRLRWTQPNLVRPIKVPGPFIVVCFMFVIPVFLFLYILVNVLMQLIPCILMLVFLFSGLVYRQQMHFIYRKLSV